MLNRSSIVNTGVLFLRLGLVAVLSLFTVRLLVIAFDIEVYGLYVVCTSVVGFAAFLQWAISGTTQRFFNVALATENRQEVSILASNIFVVTMGICGIMMGLVFALKQFLIPFLVEADSQLELANIIYINSAIVLCLLLFNSLFVGHFIAVGEIHFYALVSVIDAVLKTGAAALLDPSSESSPIVYTNALIAISLLQCSILGIVSLRRYAYLRPKLSNLSLAKIKTLLNFTGWTVFGQMTSVFRAQGLILLFSHYFGPTVVAARSVANQVANTARIFSQNFAIVTSPQLTKAYSQKLMPSLNRDAIFFSYVSFCIAWFVALPIFTNTEKILQLWLSVKIPLAGDFINLALIETVIFSMTLPLAYVVKATGYVRKYEVTLGLLQLTIIPLSLIALYFNSTPFIVYFIAIIISFIMALIRAKLAAEILMVSWVKLTCYIFLPPFLLVLLSGGLVLFSIKVVGSFFVTILVTALGITLISFCIAFLLRISLK